MTIAEKYENELKKLQRNAKGFVVDKKALKDVLVRAFKECDRKDWIRAEGFLKAIFHFKDKSYLKCWDCEQKTQGIVFKTFKAE